MEREIQITDDVMKSFKKARVFKDNVIKCSPSTIPKILSIYFFSKIIQKVAITSMDISKCGEYLVTCDGE